jgi:hypothetical protein
MRSGNSGTKMERKWNANGTQLKRNWNANGTRMERIWERVRDAFSVRLFLSSTVLKGSRDTNDYCQFLFYTRHTVEIQPSYRPSSWLSMGKRCQGMQVSSQEDCW